MNTNDSDATMAVFLDLENIALEPTTLITRDSTFKSCWSACSSKDKSW